jgi:hypothetical protein
VFDPERAVEARREAKAARRPRQPFQGPSDGRRWLALARGDGWLVEAIAAHEGVAVAVVDAAIRAELVAEAEDRAARESRPSRAQLPAAGAMAGGSPTGLGPAGAFPFTTQP